MAKINILDKKIYNQISAGEVVERPFSVCKELIENSIDAGAKNITISILNGGKSYIEVTDDGVGMDKEDLVLSITPHATSKISSVKDLEVIKTLGFRGEALASIGAVSKLTISSILHGEKMGYSITTMGGETEQVIESPIVKGTSIVCKDLFFNTPARQKFLKSDRQEENDVLDLVARLAFANPTISFKCYVDNQLNLQTFGDGLKETISSIYNDEYLINSFEISNYKNGIKIEGFISKHNFTKPNRTYQTLILNGRYVVNQTISSSIHNAYAPYLMKRKYPFYVLHVTMPSEVVDVNVTPTKSDVRFLDNQVVYGTIYSTISKVLDGTDKALDIIVKDNQSYYPSPSQVKSVDKQQDGDIIFASTTKIEQIKYKKDNFDVFDDELKASEDKTLFGICPQDETPISTTQVDIFEENKKYALELEQKKLKESKQVVVEYNETLKYVGQVLNTYLIFERGEDIFFIDQHASHEKLLYDKLINQLKIGEFAIQPLLVPYELKLNSVEYSYISSRLEYLKKIGLDISKGYDNNFFVHALPYELIDINLDEFFSDVLQDNSLKIQQIPDVINEKLMQKACKSAIKSGKTLSKSEVDSLITLLNGNINLKCPHGRPIAVRIERTEIDKWFKRIV